MTLQPTASIHMPIIGAEIHQRIPWFPLEQPIYLIMDGTREAVGQYTRTLSYQFNVMINNNQCVLQNLMPWILASGWVYNQWSRECTTMQDKMQMAAAAALRGSSRGETPVVTLPLWKERLHCQAHWEVGHKTNSSASALLSSSSSMMKRKRREGRKQGRRGST